MSYAEALTISQTGDLSVQEAESGYSQKKYTLLRAIREVVVGSQETDTALPADYDRTNTASKSYGDEPVHNLLEDMGMIELRSSLVERYREATDKLELIRSFGDDWDGHGSRAIPSYTVDWGYKVLSELVRAAQKAGTELPEPEVFAGPGGVIQFEWTWNGSEFELKYAVPENDPIFEYLWCPQSDPDSWDEGEFRGPVSENPAVKRFLAGIWH